jgi:hypothetical protein
MSSEAGTRTALRIEPAIAQKTAFSSRSPTNQKKYWQGCYELENRWVSSIQELEIKHPEPKGETS